MPDRATAPTSALPLAANLVCVFGHDDIRDRGCALTGTSTLKRAYSSVVEKSTPGTTSEDSSSQAGATFAGS
ncbi:hypothetical protein PsYK624_103750 [Phanerochaete sordida]|uniref:Uncharacterized protein n=1 Tax=Phanerochaete sordida TaxID=48140 RepID=A0A9P3GEH3_9APHY|nr:hypothetical protein PsYK624_103750 [Phanerochaete sordida]